MTNLLIFLGAALSFAIGLVAYKKTRSHATGVVAFIVAACITWLLVPSDVPSETPESIVQHATSRAQQSKPSERLTEGTSGKPDASPDERAIAADETATKSHSAKSATAGTTKSDSKQLTLANLRALRPVERPTHGYVGSDVCRECHTQQHSTWEHSYHRTMTQAATPESVLGNFDDVAVTSSNRLYEFTRQGEVCTVEMPDEHNPSQRIRAPIVMTTGSHHMQVYWFATGKKRLIGMLPMVHLNESNEWIPRESAFLVPPNMPPSFELGRWNEACSSCHSTHRKGRRLASGEWDTHVGEFGISCEACHGPAEEHVNIRRQSQQQTAAEVPDPVDDPIINPADLPKALSAQVCGQCHSVSDVLRPDRGTMENGHPYRPGLDLADTHGLWTRESPEFKRTQEALGYEDLDTLLDETFYNDGMVRVSGREYTGMVQSSCYINGEMTCLSCHKMHQDSLDSRPVKQWANDQLDVDAIGNSACTGCHTPSQYGTQHTHHPAGSSGSSCYNCHMPHTAYGLLKAIRNHQISSPNIGRDHQAKRPNACNQCHLDKTLKWSADHLQEWYEIEPPELETNEQEVAASLLWLLKGNAAERAISAWCMGWSDAKAASGQSWQLPFLAATLDDDYDAVRLVARRSIKTYENMQDFNLDVVTSTTSQERQQAAFKLLQSWSDSADFTEDRPALLIETKLGVQVSRIRQLIDQRDNSRVLLSE
ncbi:multiheme c-type cytochrome [Planctomycetes bacterium K23_9]|uniref:Doubled CXXCH motif (Paired_CXXCH_1) n=1 Tax=Stieleria marina TaxID=1930275 RepID=A0A517NS51_9BACT|nr:Doubled CXXCH motif (Paired_CXXCH_1) [Planctomycetes bacterium K23_9]